MASTTGGANVGEVRIQRYRDYPECDVIVAFRGREMVVRLPDHAQAVKWARVECKTYGIHEDFLDEHSASLAMADLRLNAKNK